MTIASDYANKLYAPHNPPTAPNLLMGGAVIRVMQNEVDERHMREQLAGLLRHRNFSPPKSVPNYEFFIRNRALEDLQLPTDTTTVMITDATSQVRTMTMRARSWPELINIIIFEFQTLFRLCPYVGIVGVCLDYKERNPARVLTYTMRKIEKAEAFAHETMRRKYAGEFPWRADDCSEYYSTLQDDDKPLTPAQIAMQTWFQRTDRGLYELALEAEQQWPYMTVGATKWFFDTRLRMEVFGALLARLVQSEQAMDAVFAHASRATGQPPVFFLDAVPFADLDDPLENYVIISGYAKGAPEGAFPVHRMIKAQDVFRRWDAEHPDYVSGVEADTRMVAHALAAFDTGCPAIIDNLDGDIPEIAAMAITLRRVLGREALRKPVVTLEDIKGDTVTAPEETPAFIWLRRTTARITVVDLLKRHYNVTAMARVYTKDRRRNEAANAGSILLPPSTELYAGAHAAARELADLALLYCAALHGNDYTLTRHSCLKQTPPSILASVIESGLGIMWAPDAPGKLMIYFRDMPSVTAATCNDLVAWRQAEFCVNYFASQLFPCIRGIDALSVSWPCEDAPGGVIEDVWEFEHWARSAVRFMGDRKIIDACEMKVYERIRHFKSIYAGHALRLVVARPDEPVPDGSIRVAPLDAPLIHYKRTPRVVIQSECMRPEEGMPWDLRYEPRK